MKKLGKSIAFINDKGGALKSTSAITLASYLFKKGFSVAIIDVDSRHTCLEWSAMADAAGKTTPFVAGNQKVTVGKEVKKLTEHYDYVIVDGMSSFLNNSKSETIGGIIANVDFVLIPTEPKPFDMWAISAFSPMIKARQALANGTPKTAIYGAQIIPNRKEWKAFIDDESVNESPFPILEEFIPDDVSWYRAVSEGGSPFDLSEKHKSRMYAQKWAESIEGFINE